MHKWFGLITVTVFLTLLFSVAPSSAATTVAGYSFNDNAFPDQLLSSYAPVAYPWNTDPAGTSLQAALTGSSLGKDAVSLSDSAYAVLKFNNIFVQNGPGADLAVFELSSAGGSGGGEPVRLTINNITNTYMTYWTGYNNNGYNGAGGGSVSGVYVALIDLNDFQIPSGGLVNVIQINGVQAWGSLGQWDTDYCVFGALNVAPVPIPGALVLFLPGLVGLAAIRRRFKQ